MTSRRFIPALLLTLLVGAAVPPSVSAQGTSTYGSNSVLAVTTCTPVSSASFDNRVHVRCSAAVSGILYFAVATSDANRAARALALFSTAQSLGRDLRIFYDPANTSGSALGCLVSDCRLADGVELL